MDALCLSVSVYFLDRYLTPFQRLRSGSDEPFKDFLFSTSLGKLGICEIF